MYYTVWGNMSGVALVAQRDEWIILQPCMRIFEEEILLPNTIAVRLHRKNCNMFHMFQSIRLGHMEIYLYFVFKTHKLHILPQLK